MGRSRRSTSEDWPEIALKVAQRIDFARLHPAVLAWANRPNRMTRGPWAVAFSGGADSLLVLLLLWGLWPRRRSGLVVLHFDHRLRPASREDARFCRNVCRSLGVRLEEGVWRKAERPEKSVSEAEARRARFGFLHQAMRSAGSRALWLGHQRNDIAESILMRLARGSGLSGLAAPRPVQKFSDGYVHVRPLLNLDREAIEQTLTAAGASWRNDESNFTSIYTRNRIRRSVIPAWQEAMLPRDVLAGVASSRDLLDEDEEALESWLAELSPLRGLRLDCSRLRMKPVAIWRRALQQWLLRLGPEAGDLSRQGFDVLLAAAMTGARKKLSLGRNGFAEIGGNHVRFTRSANCK